jgi:hypothetical protein
MTRKCIELAREGNVVALRLCLERIVIPCSLPLKKSDPFSHRRRSLNQIIFAQIIRENRSFIIYFLPLNPRG